ncbi:MAG: methylmalonyl-CoA mutase small subunit [Bacteroidetes bacterium GWC2_33_15]|nr:MAG: methylmalonyl-CoA mutase small subunit [Bacteroidetes bacterium GWA2_33_15]OFX48975.1 MAG: methylmalonyl-CoA mutase small subunit [Bacteroidetes bacterium GWC2_33_15]OFX64761.1 MAG: methylmalonyl-CoA mutase small subunit [Bacteroidetes bacterium GWB2_32_14]OFX68463.1 MAG: methylmalonyl-CoA mutase small subunit [Bacteroidetes bacterium GWD2_33_33]HAN19187.1 methylmalonyl-CoA mutase small subunit [Bacteroidales bacterium]
MADKTKKIKLFEEFPPITTQQWEEQIHKDLKGADYEKKLVWSTIEGFSVRPYYRAEHIENLKHVKYLPGEFPYVRGNKSKCNCWFIRQNIDASDVAAANKKAIDVLMKGVDSIGFDVTCKENFSNQDFETLLKNIHLESIELNIMGATAAHPFIDFLNEKVQTNKINKNEIKGSVSFDPLSHLSLNGNFCKSQDEVFETAKKLVEKAKDLPNFRVIGVNGEIFNSAGATIVQELAFALSMGNQYLTLLTETGLDIDTVAQNMKFNFGVSSNYFMEIAKFRAARMLWAQIVDAYKPKNKEVAKMIIHATTSKWNQTVYDPYVNLLRGTTESMSATIAGIDSLTVTPFNNAFEKATDFSDRIARNTQILLKEESYFDKIADPAGGSYYIETLTASIAEHAWKLFQEIESKGGYIESFKAGFIQEKVNETANKRNLNIASRREILLGTNQYPNALEKADSKIIADTIISKSGKRNDAIAEPIKPYRGAEQIELMRLKTDKIKETPRVFLLTIGDLTMRKARAGFASGFFACAGFKVIDNLGFNSVDEGIKAALDQKANIVVVCSSDDEYPTVAPAVFEKLKGKAITVVAGYPASVEELKSKGIKHFIHMKSNLIETLQGFQAELGI